MQSEAPWVFSGSDLEAKIVLSLDDIQGLLSDKFVDHDAAEDSHHLQSSIRRYREGDAGSGPWWSDVDESNRPLKEQISDRILGKYPMVERELGRASGESPPVHSASSIIPRFEPDQPFGYSVNRVKYARGDPFCYNRRVWDIAIDEGNTATVRVMIGFGGNGGEDSKRLAEICIEASKYVDSLVLSGRSVEVLGISVVRKRDDDNRIAVEMIDLTHCSIRQAACVLASAAIYRSAMLGVLDTLNKGPSWRGWEGYGQSMTLGSTLTIQQAKGTRGRLEAAGFVAPQDVLVWGGSTKEQVREAFEGRL